eukprot:TRINITY_DN5620_c0_g1_i2.p2 TRINITY_DN5620_c0_g1~~TRINITY_DN5620_c0_g1_i2.p2  ORF type:complete len:313 (+),score=77.77 TRINITY_DN5620_c0_g1_i2:46-939(+)
MATHQLLTKHVLVFGATAGLGRHLVQELIQFKPGMAIVCVVRNMELGLALYGHVKQIRLLQGDLTDSNFMKQAVQGIDYVFVCSGSSHLFKFGELMGWQDPSPRTHPKFVDFEGIRNLCVAAKEDGCVKHIVMVSASHVTRPFRPIAMFTNVIACNTLPWKLEGENALRQSGIPYTIVRPAQFVEHGLERNISLDQGDKLSESASISRKSCAKILLRILDNLKDSTNKTFEIYEPSKFGKKVDQVTFDGLRIDLESHYRNSHSLIAGHKLAARVFFVILVLIAVFVFLILFYTISSS